MPVTSSVNIHAKPSMRSENARPSAGIHSMSKRTVSPRAISG